MDLSQATTAYPTKPGIYLFLGSYEPPTHHTVLKRVHYPDVIRVTQAATGGLLYMGKDFMYHPAKSVGLWVEITDFVGSAQEAVATHLRDSSLHIVTDAITHNYCKREFLVEGILRFNTTPGGEAVLNDMVDRAFAKGLIYEEGGYLRKATS